MNRRTLLAALLMLTSSALAPTPLLAAGFSSDRIGVTTVGQGRDVMLIPGMGSSPRVWAQLVKAVPGYRYHLVHVLGFAGRPAGGNMAGPVAAPVAEEIARYIAETRVKAPAVIGHSMGGTIGMMLAARHPKAVSKLMVVDMVPFMGMMFGPPGATADGVRPTADALLAKLRATDPAQRRAQAEATIAGMIDTAAMRAPAVEDSVASDPDVSARSFHELIVTDLRPELPDIAAPTTVLYVTPKGVPLSDAQMDAVYKASFAPLKGAALKRIPASAHFIMWDQPQRFRSEVEAFLNPGSTAAKPMR